MSPLAERRLWWPRREFAVTPNRRATTSQASPAATSDKADRTAPYDSFFHLPCVSGAQAALKYGLDLAACCMFSDWLVHSKFDAAGLRRFESIWFIWHLSSVFPTTKWSPTSLWTKKVLIFPVESDKLTAGYPLDPAGLRRTLPGYGLGPHLPLLMRLRLFTLPMLLTSYKPSYPTTGSHFSSSILRLFPGLMPSLRSLTGQLTAAFSRIARWLFLSAQPLTHLVRRPASGASPGRGLVCKS